MGQDKSVGLLTTSMYVQVPNGRSGEEGGIVNVELVLGTEVHDWPEGGIVNEEVHDGPGGGGFIM